MYLTKAGNGTEVIETVLGKKLVPRSIQWVELFPGSNGEKFEVSSGVVIRPVSSLDRSLGVGQDHNFVDC